MANSKGENKPCLFSAASKLHRWRNQCHWTWNVMKRFEITGRGLGGEVAGACTAKANSGAYKCVKEIANSILKSEAVQTYQKLLKINKSVAKSELKLMLFQQKNIGPVAGCNSSALATQLLVATSRSLQFHIFLLLLGVLHDTSDLLDFFILFPHRLFGLVFTSTEGYSWTCRAYTAWSQKREWYAAFASFRGFFFVLFQVLNTWRGCHFMTATSKGPKDFFQNSSVNLEAKYLLFRIFVWLRWMAIHPHGFDWPSETLNSWSFQVYSYTSNVFYSNSELGNHKGRQ